MKQKKISYGLILMIKKQNDWKISLYLQVPYMVIMETRYLDCKISFETKFKALGVNFNGEEGVII